MLSDSYYNDNILQGWVAVGSEFGLPRTNIRHQEILVLP